MHRKNAQNIYRWREMVSMGFTKNGFENFLEIG